MANASERPVVVFIHGLWLLPSSWEPWRQLFDQAGYATVAPSWPDDPETVAEARANPEVFAGKTIGDVANHVAAVIAELAAERAVVGHSFGGLLAQIIAAHGFSRATVAIDPAPFRGILKLPSSALKAAKPVLRNPANYGRGVTLTFERFRYAWANALSEEEARLLYDTFHVPAPGAPLFQAAFANLNPWSPASVDTKSPVRRPLLLVSGGKDETVPWTLVNAAFNLQRRNRGVQRSWRSPSAGTRSRSTAAGATSPRPRLRSSDGSSSRVRVERNRRLHAGVARPVGLAATRADAHAQSRRPDLRRQSRLTRQP